MSRLNSVLREDKGFTYGANSWIDARKLGTTIIISTTVENSSAIETIRLIFDQLRKFSTERLDDDEITRAVRYMMGSFARSVESPAQVSALISGLDLLNLPDDYYDHFYRKISETTTDDVLGSQQKYFNPQGWTISVCGNVKSFMDELRQFGSLNVLNEEAMIIETL